jgi:predicted glycoside hydrolase/deacetylase ChbG (UPF0249 family)
MERMRRLVVTADDFGIGPMTTRGILRLALGGRVTCAVLIVNAPDAERSVDEWRAAGRPMELGWHPCFTLDRPISKPRDVASLVDRDGRFLNLGTLLKRLAMGRVRRTEVAREARSQYDRFIEIVGTRPTVVNAHHHLHVFPVIGGALLELFARDGVRPYIRRVQEPLSTFLRIPGARIKRFVLGSLGSFVALKVDRLGFPGNDWLAGVTENACLASPDFFARWLATIPGQTVELMCHPGEYDLTLEGRDGSATDGGLDRRVKELKFLEHDDFLQACARAGFELIAPSVLSTARAVTGARHAA